MGVVHKVKRAAAAAESQMNSTAPPPVPASSATPISKYPRFGKRGAPQAFPSKLYEILEGENPEIVGWTATGRGFEVRDHARLSSEVLGRFFKQDKFSSFQRQLNLYGFRKVTKGSEAGSYQHPHFRRGERTTLLTIRRSTKPSPARVVPNSPASRATAPTVPLPSSSSTLSMSSSSSSSTVSVSSSGGADKKPRPATPSPPPAPVRGILPWPRQPATGATDGNVESGVPSTSPPSRGLGVPPSISDRHTSEHQRQQSDNRGGETGVWGGVHRGSGSYLDYMGAAPTSCNDKLEWKSDARPRREAPMTAPSSSSSLTGSIHSSKGSSWENQMIKKENERTQGLDHQDVEVVGLLQQMAKKAQDSPSRRRSAATTGSTSTSSPTSSSTSSLSTPRWEGRGSGGAPLGDGPQPQSRYTMSRSPPRSHQMISSEGLHDIPSHERMENPPRGPFPYAFDGDDNRAVGVHHPSRQRLPAPRFPSTSSGSKGYHEQLRRGDTPGGERDGPTHVRQHQERGPAFESNVQPSTGGNGRPVFRYNYEGNEVDGYRRGGPDHWQESERQYPGASVSLSYSKYRGEDMGKFGSGMGTSVGPEKSWTQHRQYQGGR